MLLISIFLWLGCRKNTTTCYEPKNVNATINFSTKLERQIDTLIDSIVYDTTLVTYRDTSLPLLNALTLNVDSPIFITSSSGVSYIGLMLNPSADFTTYRIGYDTGITYFDTITIFHKSTPAFINNNCGYTYFFTIDSIQYTSAVIDSFILQNKNITRESGVNNRMANFYFFNQ